jgi:hypothetical protein
LLKFKSNLPYDFVFKKIGCFRRWLNPWSFPEVSFCIEIFYTRHYTILTLQIRKPNNCLPARNIAPFFQFPNVTILVHYFQLDFFNCLTYCSNCLFILHVWRMIVCSFLSMIIFTLYFKIVFTFSFTIWENVDFPPSLGFCYTIFFLISQEVTICL